MPPLALALDTSTAGFTLALFDGQKLLHACHDAGPVPQSQMLIKAMDEAFQVAKITPEKIHDVIFCNGPGRFTSLRVGLATLMGLFAPQADTIGFYQVSSLWVRCMSLPAKNNRVALIRAGREKCYAGFLQEEQGRESFREGIFTFRELEAELQRLAGDIVIFSEEPELLQQTPDLERFGKLSANPVIEPRFFFDCENNPHFQKNQMNQARLNYFLNPLC